MRASKPLHLAHLDPERAAESILWAVYARAKRDANRLGLVLDLPAHVNPKSKVGPVIAQSVVYKVAQTCAVWAITGRGSIEEVRAALRELRADLAGVAPGEGLEREPDLTTEAGVLVVAAQTRLDVADGRTVEAVAVATLASVDERSIRAAATAGTLPPVGPGRPMRFAPDVVQHYLYTRGVPGFGPRGAPSGPAGGPAPR